MSKPVFFLSALAALMLLHIDSAFALDTGLMGGGSYSHQKRSGLASSRLDELRKSQGAATPFGGAHSRTQVGKRPEDQRRPSAMMCALQEQSGRPRPSAVTRQEASGKLHLANDPSSLKGQSADIYSDCDLAGARSNRAGIRVPGSTLRSGGGRNKSVSIHDSKTNTLKAATPGYYDRSASASLMPKKSASLYDPLTGAVRPPKVLSAYGVYQTTQ